MLSCPSLSLRNHSADTLSVEGLIIGRPRLVTIHPEQLGIPRRGSRFTYRGRQRFPASAQPARSSLLVAEVSFRGNTVGSQRTYVTRCAANPYVVHCGVASRDSYFPSDSYPPHVRTHLRYFIGVPVRSPPRGPSSRPTELSHTFRFGTPPSWCFARETLARPALFRSSALLARERPEGKRREHTGLDYFARFSLIVARNPRPRLILPPLACSPGHWKFIYRDAMGNTATRSERFMER